MKFRGAIDVVVLSLLLLLHTPMVVAQDETPEPGATASQLLPSASIFGQNWSQLDLVSPDILAEYSFTMSPDVFKEGAATTYLGPNGTRILVVNLILTDNRVAIRKSWEDSSDLMSYLTTYLDTDYSREADLETMDAPDGCVEAKRTEGTGRGYLVPVGGTLCAIDPDGILLVLVNGSFNDLTGINASDSVVGLILNGEGTPTS